MSEIRAGLVDADLGAGLLKKRIPIAGRGKRGGARTILASAIGTHAFFLFGFLMNDREDLEPEEFIAFKQVGIELLTLTAPELDRQVAIEELQEICHAS